MQSQNKKENNENLEQKINEKTVRKKKKNRFMGLSKKLNDSKTTAEEAELHKIMKHASYCCFKRCDFDLLNLLTTIVYNQDSISVSNKEIYTRMLQSC